MASSSKESRVVPRWKQWVVVGSVALVLTGRQHARAQSGPANSGQQLEALVTAEQAALDANDPNGILVSARQLGFFGLQLLGSLYERQGRCVGAAESYRQALSVTGDAEMRQQRVETQLLLLTAELCSDHASAADTITADVLTLAGNTAQVHLLLSGARNAAGDLPGVIAELKQALQLDPQLGPAHLALGNAYWELNEYQYNDDSLREFTVAHTLMPDNVTADLNLGSVLSQYERYDEARPLLQKAAETDPSSPNPWLQLGMNAYAQGHVADAMLALNKAVMLTGDNEALNSYQIRRVYAALSRLEFEQGHAAAADAWSQRELTLRKKISAADVSAPLTESTGMTTDASHQTPPRPGANTTAPEPLSPENEALARRLKQIVAKSLNDAGTVYARNRDFGAALPLFRLAAGADPEQPPFMRNLGLAAFHTADYATAIDAFTHALKLAPDDALVQNDLAQARSLVAAPPSAPKP